MRARLCMTTPLLTLPRCRCRIKKRAWRELNSSLHLNPFDVFYAIGRSFVVTFRHPYSAYARLGVLVPLLWLFEMRHVKS